MIHIQPKLQRSMRAGIFTVASMLSILLLISSTLSAQDFRSAGSTNPVANGFEIQAGPNLPAVQTNRETTPEPGSGFVVESPPEPQSESESESQSESLEESTQPNDSAATVIPAVVPSARLTDMLRRGGVLMIPIGICSLILMVFVFERMISLRKGRIIPGPFVTRVLEQVRSGELNRESAVSLCERNGSPIANVFKAGLAKWGRPSVEIEQAVLDEGERESNRLRRYLRLINGVATVCPLLGMLGTVLGMIHAFDAIAATAPMQAEPGMTIATGISQALLTTAAGLTVAIPALIAYLFFSGRADRHVMELDSLGMKIVNLVSSESLAINRKSQSQSLKVAANDVETGSRSTTAKSSTKKTTTRKAA